MGKNCMFRGKLVKMIKDVSSKFDDDLISRIEAMN